MSTHATAMTALLMRIASAESHWRREIHTVLQGDDDAALVLRIGERWKLLTPVQRDIMRAIWRHENRTHEPPLQSHLAFQFGVSRATMLEHINHLVGKGVLRRNGKQLIIIGADHESAKAANPSKPNPQNHRPVSAMRA